LSDVDFARTLAAVLAADIAGYSRLMQKDEDATMAAWWSYRREIVDPAIAAKRGRIVKLTGDGFLAEFPSVSDAVAAAIAIQSEIGDRLRDVPQEDKVQFRIGINLGDILKDDEDIYGDGVNIAARIEALAEPGGIWVSASVNEQIRHRPGYQLEDMGEHALKNIEQPVRAFRVLFDGAPEISGQQTASAEAAVAGAGGSEKSNPAIAALAQSADAPPVSPNASDRPAIAVLPFDNLGGDPEQDYFADGITEDLITELSRFQELLVIARNTVFTYRGKAVKVQDVGRDLNVRYVLEGSVRRAGERVRIAAQLIDAEGGHHIWAERFDRTLEDIFDVQDEVVQKIVSTLSGKLVETERNRAQGSGAEAMKAYDLVLKGRGYWQKFTADNNLKARELYQQAIELDPAFSRAYASLAWTHMIDASERWSDDPKVSLEAALDAARTGVRVNPDSHSNFSALASVYLALHRHAEAIDAQQRAIDINPNDPDGYPLLARILTYAGRVEEAMPLIEKGRAMPLTPPAWYNWFEGMVHYTKHDYEDAITALRKLNTPSAGPFRWMAISYAQLGQEDAAREAAAEYRRRSPDFEFDHQLKTEPFLLETDKQHYIDGMTKAGLGPS